MARVLVDRKSGWSGGAFYGYALREAKTSWDDATNFDYRLAGVTASRTLGQGPTAPKLELLYVNSDKRGAGNPQRRTRRCRTRHPLIRPSAR